MAKICPECQYPNLDKAETCFKCGADISEERIREERARINVERRRTIEENREEQIQTDNEPWSILNFYKLDVENNNISFKGINYSNRLLKTIDMFIIIFLTILVLIIIGGVITTYNIPISIEKSRVSLAVIKNRTSRAIYETEMQTYRELVDLQRQLGSSSITPTPPSEPTYESEEFNPKVRLRAFVYSISSLVVGIIIILIMLLVYWIIRCIIINNIEHQKAIKYNFENIDNYFNNISGNINIIKNYYTEDNNGSNIEN